MKINEVTHIIETGCRGEATELTGYGFILLAVNGAEYDPDMRGGSPFVYSLGYPGDITDLSASVQHRISAWDRV